MEVQKKSIQIKTLGIQIPIKGFKVPDVPHFIESERSKSLGFSISEFSDEDLIKIGKAWTANLIEAAREKRKKTG